MPKFPGEPVFTGFLGAQRVTIPHQTSGVARQIFPVPTPAIHAGLKIEIERSIVRLHTLQFTRNLYATDALLVRASDSAILNGAVIDIGLLVQEGIINPVAERDIDIKPSFFAVDFAADQLVCVAEAFFDPMRDPPPDPRPLAGPDYICEVDIIYAYHLVPTPQFTQVHWISTGNYLLGLKDDGTIWKSTAPTANPLVFTEVYPT